jgi:hypothetical protein
VEAQQVADGAAEQTRDDPLSAFRVVGTWFWSAALVASLFAPWYEVSFLDGAAKVGLSGWSALTRLDIFMVACASISALTVAALVATSAGVYALRRSDQGAGRAFTGGALVLAGLLWLQAAGALLTLALLGVRVMDDYGASGVADASPTWGLFVAVFAAIALTQSAFAAARGMVAAAADVTGSDESGERPFPPQST